MDAFDMVYRTVSGAVEAERVGTPAFVRCIAQVASTRAELDANLCRALGAVAEWLGEPPRRVFALGGSESGGITVTAESERGRTAIVSVGLAFDRAPRVDLLLIGNRGALHHEGVPVPMIEGPDGHISVPEAPAGLMDAVHRSLSTGQVEALEG